MGFSAAPNHGCETLPRNSLQVMKVDLAEQLARARRDGGAYLIPSKLEIRLRGADAFRYLNGQITRDLRRLGTNEAVSACILTPRGKLCAPLLIRRDGDDLIVESEPILEEALTARLERYIVADDVTLSVHPPRSVIHVFGEVAIKEPWASAEGIRVTRLGQPGKDFDPATPEVQGLELIDPRVVEVLRIERGIPAWGAELTEEILPPEAGLDLTHIDYDRGCYPGQEVISRLKSVGRVNRLLHHIKALSESKERSLARGSAVVSEGGREVGLITSVAPGIEEGLQTALGYVSRIASESGEPLFILDPLTGGKTPLSISQVTGP